MRAAVVEERGKLTVGDVPDPEPGDHEALCEVLYGATCVATDDHLINDTFLSKITYPMILGHESVGRVVRVGSKARYLKEGDLIARVGTPPVGEYKAFWGGFAEFGIVPDHRAMAEDGLPEKLWKRERRQAPFPEALDPRAATMLITWRETFSFIQRMGVGRGARVLVIGSGGNGLSFTRHARNLGAEKVVMIGSASREAEAKEAGAEALVDYKTDDWLTAVQDVFEGKFDFMIDAIAKRDNLDRVLKRLAHGGTASVYGVEERMSVALHPMAVGGSFSFYNGGYDEAEVHDEVVRMAIDGRLDASLFLDLDNPWPLEDICDAYEAVNARKKVKALIRIRG